MRLKSHIYLALHGIGVDLAHEESLIFALDVGYNELPELVAVVAHRDAGVVRDDVRVDRLDRLRVGLDPADAVAAQVGHVTREHRFRPKRHRQIRHRLLELGQVAPLRSNSTS